MEHPRSIDTWLSGDPYEQYVGRWSRIVAPRFLSWLHIPPARRWLDVGCGTGALSAAILECCSPASVVGIDPSNGFLARARQQLAGRAVFRQGPASEIALDDSAVDATVSALVLNFVPDALAALAEMSRVTTAGGTIGAYVWDYAEKMDLIRVFWDAAIELDPQALPFDEGLRFPLCRPPALTELFARAGLRDVDVNAIDIATRFADFDDYWHPFLGGQGPAPTYAMGLTPTQRDHLRECIRARLPLRPDGSVSLSARVWAVRGTVTR